MRTTKLLFGSVLLLAFIFSCNQNPNNPDKNTISAQDVKQKRTKFKPLKKDSFDVWKARWANDSREYMQTHTMEYFDMELIDLRTILLEKPLDNARFYLGMSSDTLPHLMLVGTHGGVVNYSTIADYTTICPPRCQ